MQKLQFSGHESFHCRQFWLKKGFDFVSAGNKFSSESAVVDLGVGKNMVTSIRFWMRAFGMLNDKEKLTTIATRIFEDNGWDPYLEDEGTLWLLHYHLTKGNVASVFNLVFTEVRKAKPEFSKSYFYSVVSSKGQFSEATLSKDFGVFQGTYMPTSKKKSEIEDSYSGILTELNFLSTRTSLDEELLVLESKRRPDIPAEIILYAILENEDYGNSIDFEKLYKESTGVGTLFALNREGLTEKLEEIVALGKGNIIFKNDAGVRELQFRNKPNALDVLRRYYAGR